MQFQNRQPIVSYPDYSLSVTSKLFELNHVYRLLLHLNDLIISKTKISRDQLLLTGKKRFSFPIIFNANRFRAISWEKLWETFERTTLM